MTGNYSWRKSKDSVVIGINTYAVLHIQDERETLVALCDSAEKAHFLATAANAFGRVEELEEEIESLKNEMRKPG